MAIEITKTSYLNFADYLEVDGFTFFDTPDFPELTPQDGDRFINVTDEYINRLDLLAFDEYGDAQLWWVIALANNIDLVPSQIRLNQRLRIPDKSFVDSLFSKKGKR